MSNPESFIDEVSEEVRKDRLFSLIRKWGWIPALAVVAIVGGAAWTEWNKAQTEARAEAFGDAVLAAIGASDMPARRDALGDVAAQTPEQEAIRQLLLATTFANGDDRDPDAARAQLVALAEAPGLPDTYRHLALMKIILDGGTGEAGEDAAILETLAQPGAPYRALAIEQQALLALKAGDEATAITLLRAVSEDANTTESLRRRAVQLIVALGASPDPA